MRPISLLLLVLALHAEAESLPLAKPDQVGFSAERLERLHTFVKTSAPGSVGTFGWGGYATTSVEIDFQEKCLFFFQHVPYDQDGILGKCSRLAYQALVG